jgi:putative PIN family toxin of toxin-antitoxin system
MRVVLDTNVLLVSISSFSPFHPILRALLDGRYELSVNTEILLEYEEQLAARLGHERTALQLDDVLNRSNVHLAEPHFRWNLIQADPDDNKFVDCALATNADYLVTNDRHFDVLKTLEFPRLMVITAQEFLAEIPKLYR